MRSKFVRCPYPPECPSRTSKVTIPLCDRIRFSMSQTALQLELECNWSSQSEASDSEPIRICERNRF